MKQTKPKGGKKEDPLGVDERRREEKESSDKEIMTQLIMDKLLKHWGAERRLRNSVCRLWGGHKDGNNRREKCS
jgi:hypothetical protein